MRAATRADRLPRTPELSEVAASLRGMNGTLPPVVLTPEQAAAIAVALATQPDGPYAADGRAALHAILAVLDPQGRERTVELAERVRAPRSTAHPAGRARRTGPAASGSPVPVGPGLAPVVHLRSVR